MIFSAHLFLLVQSAFGKPPDKLISIPGSGKGSGTRSLGQAKALEPLAPGSSKGSGAMSLGQAKALEPFAWAKRKLKEPSAWATHKLKGQKARKSSGLQSPTLTNNLPVVL